MTDKDGTVFIPPTGNVFGNKRAGDTPKTPPKKVGILKRLWRRLWRAKQC